MGDFFFFSSKPAGKNPGFVETDKNQRAIKCHVSGADTPNREGQEGELRRSL